MSEGKYDPGQSKTFSWAISHCPLLETDLFILHGQETSCNRGKVSGKATVENNSYL